MSNKNTSMVVAGTIILLAAIGAVVYLISTDRPTEVAAAFMAPIVLAVLAAVYNTTQISRVEGKIDTIGVNTNGVLDRRIRAAVLDALNDRETIIRQIEVVHRNEDTRG